MIKFDIVRTLVRINLITFYNAMKRLNLRFETESAD
jgi:hypothetical protein